METNLFFKDDFNSSRKTTKGKTKAMLIGNRFADQAIVDFDKDTRVTGLTNGKFSLISLIQAALKKTGPANVIISTWSAGFYDSTTIHDLLKSNLIIDIKIILDRSFKTRQVEYSTLIQDLFKNENIRTTNTHSKFVLIYNQDWNVCIRSSMNLNENKRCENFDIDNDLEIFQLFKDFSDELFASSPEGIIESRSIVDPVFDKIFKDEGESPSAPPAPAIDPSEYINVLLDLYKPVYSSQEATHFFSTDEIYSAIKDLNPDSDLSKSSVYKAMIDAGFIYKVQPGKIGLDFRWLLSQK